MLASYQKPHDNRTSSILKALSPQQTLGPTVHLKGAGDQPLLKVRLPDGGWQLVMRGSAGDEKGMQPLGVGAGKANSTTPLLVVSGEVFSALSIAMALPTPLDLNHFRGIDDDELIVKEV